MTPFERDFERFWLAYPRRKAKGAARKAFEKALKLADIETICEGALNYARENQHTEARYIKHPATWLNQECWDDEPDQPDAMGFKAALLAQSPLGPLGPEAGTTEPVDQSGPRSGCLRVVSSND